MGLGAQIAWGTLLLTLCSGLHLVLILATAGWLRRVGRARDHVLRVHRAGAVLGLAVLIVVVGHIAQIWLWALAYLWLDALNGVEPAIYFALSNYTTLGYGDLLLDADLRVFAAFASVNGMLIFGVSTAYLVTVIARILPRNLVGPPGPP